MSEYSLKKEQLKKINMEAAKYFYAMLRKPEGEEAMKYFKNRELSDETLKSFGLGYAGKKTSALYKYLSGLGFSDELLLESGLVIYDSEKKYWKNKFWNRAMFPIKNMDGEVIAFGGRVMDDSKPKYLNSSETPVFNKSNNLYAFDKAINSDKPYFILCEGYMDVISMHQAGFDCAIAALGTAYTKNHAEIIKHYVNDVYLSFDSDGPGLNAALRAIPICKEAGLNCKVINMKPYKDPDEFIKNLGKEEFEKRIKNAENDFIFYARAKQIKYNMDDLDSKIEFLKDLAYEATKIEDFDEVAKNIDKLNNENR